MMVVKYATLMASVLSVIMDDFCSQGKKIKKYKINSKC
jgi:hypothetical protein